MVRRWRMIPSFKVFFLHWTDASKPSYLSRFCIKKFVTKLPQVKQRIQTNFDMIAIVMFMCSIAATKVKRAAHQCFQCIWKPDFCSEDSWSYSEMGARQKMCANFESSETSFEMQGSSTHLQSTQGFLHTQMAANARTEKFSKVQSAQRVQSLDAHCRSAIKRISCEPNLNSRVVRTQTTVSVYIRRKRNCVLEMAAMFEKDSNGCLLGR